jgi:tRNA-2-methylthio-N6-dimethylallyladenosine synthase
MAQPTIYLETMGCQMNVLDSELVLGRLRADGFVSIDNPAEADVVLFNTCSVRDHAEQKVLSRLGALRRAKGRRPDMIIGVIGCMAQRDPDGIVERMPHVDLLCSPAELNKIPAMIEDVRTQRGRAIALSHTMSRKSTPLKRNLEFDSVEALDLSREPEPQGNTLQAYVRVQRGCDKFCTYCVVPFTRGPERSRPPRQIVDETRMLADRGAREITLLGQTVNSYVHEEDGKEVRFADLLARVHEVEGIERIRFVTSFPGDFTDDILYAMRDLPKVCEYLHLPVQSGSDRMLQAMRRQNTAAEYYELVDRAREIVPGIAMASDFIVGFSGETEEDHQASMEMVERCGFKNIFVFKYSPRPGTVADKRQVDDVPDEVKRRRNHEMLALQASLALPANQQLVGNAVEVLIEGYSKAAIKAQEAEQTRGEEVDLRAGDQRDQHGGDHHDWRTGDQLVGRTRQDQIVVFAGREEHIGRFADVRITAATAVTLHGELLTDSLRGTPAGPNGVSRATSSAPGTGSAPYGLPILKDGCG